MVSGFPVQVATCDGCGIEGIQVFRACDPGAVAFRHSCHNNPAPLISQWKQPNPHLFKAVGPREPLKCNLDNNSKHAAMKRLATLESLKGTNTKDALTPT